MCYMCPVSEPERIGIRELRQHASRYVAMAKAGKRIAVTDRGELVAYLVPAQADHDVPADGGRRAGHAGHRQHPRSSAATTGTCGHPPVERSAAGDA
jgi:prevent-host-death family protein